MCNFMLDKMLKKVYYVYRGKMKLRKNERYNKELDIIEKYCNSCASWLQVCKFPFSGPKNNSGPSTAVNCHYCRNAVRVAQTPLWADKKTIGQMYRNCPKGYEVDHIIPLHGKTVSGLHTRENLQYLTQQANRLKHNKFNNL